MTRVALLPSRLLTPAGFEQDRCVVIEGGRIAAVVPASDCPADTVRRG